ncbi:MAG TPA: aquaporin [Thermomicrobiales bacterium]|jgi:aquaporin Z|nr:aquaporin [Thermomicrobiales bacterium]
MRNDSAAAGGSGSPTLWRACAAETFGTFALTLVAAGAGAVAAGRGDIDPLARAVAPGLTVLAMIYALGAVSGAHLNPAVTLAFALRGVFPWRRVPAYWLVQMAGAVAASLLLRALFGASALVAGMTRADGGIEAALTMEIVLTLLLVTVILGTATRERLLGPNAGIAVGSTVALAGLFAAPVSGASMNPARSLGPALGAWSGTGQWVYLLGPAVGAAIAVVLAWLLYGPPRPPEADAARGDARG